MGDSVIDTRTAAPASDESYCRLQREVRCSRLRCPDSHPSPISIDEVSVVEKRLPEQSDRLLPTSANLENDLAQRASLGEVSKSISAVVKVVY